MRNTTRTSSSTRPCNWLAKRRTLGSAVLFSASALVCVCASSISASAQMTLGPASARSLTAVALSEDHASLDLPDAPGASVDGVSSSSDESVTPSAQNFAGSQSPAAQASSSLPEASRSQRYPRPGQPAPVLTAGDKVRMGFTGALSFYAVAGWIASAGYEQAINGSPNWGTDRGAFGQRLWCAAARATSENLFSDAVFAPMLHEDPRYYRLGRTHKFLPRLAYAATRSIITRSDSGATVPNLSQIFGNAAGSALTYAYYPESNRTAKDTAETFAGSIGGTALGDVIAEFVGRILFNHDRD